MPFLSDKRTGPKGSKRKLQLLSDSVYDSFKSSPANKPIRGAGAGEKPTKTAAASPGMGRAMKPGRGASGSWGSSAVAAPSLAKATGKGGRAAGSAKAAPAPAPKKSLPSRKPYVSKGVADYNKDVGGFYLNATSGMFSDKAGGKKKR